MIANESSDNSPPETKMTQKLTIIGHRTAFNNEQNLYRIVSYKRPRNDNVHLSIITCFKYSCPFA